MWRGVCCSCNANYEQTLEFACQTTVKEKEKTLTRRKLRIVFHEVFAFNNISNAQNIAKTSNFAILKLMLE